MLSDFASKVPHIQHFSPFLLLPSYCYVTVIISTEAPKRQGLCQFYSLLYLKCLTHSKYSINGEWIHEYCYDSKQRNGKSQVLNQISRYLGKDCFYLSTPSFKAYLFFLLLWPFPSNAHTLNFSSDFLHEKISAREKWLSARGNEEMQTKEWNYLWNQSTLNFSVTLL